MNTEELIARAEIKDLVDTFSNLADIKDAKSQGDLFLPNGKLEFQMGFDGEIHEINGHEALVTAFANTINPCLAVYHINGQQNAVFNDDYTEAKGTAYCEATLVNEEEGKKIITTNYVRYTDEYQKTDNKWYIKKRRTTFLILEKRELS